MMIIYDPRSYTGKCVPWHRTYFDGCFGERTDSPSKCSWVVPGTWPEWAL